jgi:diguanylate cyclase (GGDEF)-like protein
MYLPFVMYGYAAALALVLLGCGVMIRVVPGLRGIRELALAVSCAILAVGLVGLRPWIPAFWTILVGNFALLIAFALIYWTTARVLAEPPRFLPWAAALCVANIPLFWYFTWIRPDLVLRIWFSSGTLAIFTAATAVLLFRHRSPVLFFSARVLGAVQAVTCVIQLGRCLLSSLYPPADFVHGDWVQIGFTYGQFVLCLATCGGIIWLSFCQNRATLEQQALCDSLTGLLNRRAFDDILHREIERTQRSGTPRGLILIDLDRFKEVNDTRGHNAGDEVLRQVSALLRQAVRPSDTLARYGGEEFVLLVRSARPDETEAIAERLRESIEQCAALPFNVWLTASVGVAMSYPGETAAELLDRCDSALYASKRAGRNRVSVHPPIHSSAALQSALRPQ